MEQCEKDGSLTALYNALRDSRDPGHARCIQQLANTESHYLDKSLRRLLVYAQTPSEHWSLHRLLRLLILIFKHAPRTHLLSLRSFREAVQLAIRQLQRTFSLPDGVVGQAAAKFLCHLFEYLAKVDGQTASSAADALLQHIRRHGGIAPLLQGTLSPHIPIQRSCLRALAAKAHAFAQELVNHDAFLVLAKTMGDLQDALRKRDDTLQARALDLVAMACRIWEQIAKAIQPSQLTQYAESIHFLPVHQAWTAACTHYREEPHLSKLARIVFSLTGIVDRCVLASNAATSQVVTPLSRERSLGVLALELRQVLTYSEPSAERDMSVSHSIRLLQLALHMIDDIPNDTYRTYFIHQIVYDTTNFITLFLSRIAKPEDRCQIGDPALIPHDICVDTEVYDSLVDGAHVEKYAGLLSILLECFIRYVQIAQPDLVTTVAPRAAWCIKALLSVLHKADLLEQSRLKRRLRRLVVFFLHEEAAISELAKNSSGIRQYVWKPTITNAKEGLVAAAHCDSAAEIESILTSINKAKRALVSLELISRQPRACERIVAEDVLDLVDMALIPSDAVLHASEPIQTMYALFARFVAALTSLMAFVRAKLRESYPIIPLTMTLLTKAIHCDTKPKNARKDLMVGCLQIVLAFQFDDMSLRQWLVWKCVNDATLEGALATLPWRDGTRFPLFSTLVTVLLPWDVHSEDALVRVKDSWQLQTEAIFAAASVFERLALLPDFCRQLIPDTATTHRLGQLLVYLSEFVYEDESCDKSHAKDANAYEHKDVPVEYEEDVKRELTQNAVHCFRQLYRGLTHVFDETDNIETLVLHNTVTTLFEPLLAETGLDSVSPLNQWRHSKFCALLVNHMDHLMNLFAMTRGQDGASKTHELAAVAICHVCPLKDWKTRVGIRPEQDSASLQYPFGVICRMLVFAPKDSMANMATDDQTTLNRQKAAAQAMEMMSRTLEGVWREERHQRLKTLEEQCQAWTPLKVKDNNEARQVVILADENNLDDDDNPNEPITVSGRVLKQHSMVFSAMLSEDYAESANAPIRLHEVTRKGLRRLFSVATTMSREGGSYCLPASMHWTEVVDLLLVADRFCCEAVANLCHRWVLTMVCVLPVQSSCLDGCVYLFRHCRDKSSCDSGLYAVGSPFHTVLHECLRAIAGRLSLARTTPTFTTMIHEAKSEELDSFCDALTYLFESATD